MTGFPILMFVRGAIVLALALVAVRLLRRAPASLRHAVLGSALAAVLVLPVIALLVPTWHAGAFAAEPVALVAPALPVAESGGPAHAQPASLTAAPEPLAPVPWAQILGGVWAAGSLALLARAAVGAVRARRIARRGTPARTLAAALAEAWRALDGDGRAPRVVVSGEVDAPIVVGTLAPAIVVPLAAVAWTAERWRVVLLHELAHVRRRDGVANLIAQLACALHWPDPLAWIAARRLRHECELSADDAVLRAGTRASTYAEHLVDIAATATFGVPGAALAMAEGARLEARCVALLDADRSRAPAGRGRAVVAALLTAGVAVLAACVSPEAAPGGADEPTAPATRPDAALQKVVDGELDRTVAQHHASGAVAIVLDAASGDVLAIASRGGVDARRPRAPGSTLKPFTFAAALDARTVERTSRIDCENGQRAYGDKVLHDSAPHGVLDLPTVLAVSSNVCTAKIAESLGDRFGEALRRLHIPVPARVDMRTLEGAALASGEGVPVTPLELATAYTAFANGGVIRAGGATDRVMRADTAEAVLAMLEGVVTSPDGTGHAAAISGVRVAGKTGTASASASGELHYASFVGIVPADAPRFVVLVGVDGVEGMGGTVAAPAFATIATRALGR